MPRSQELKQKFYVELCRELKSACNIEPSDVIVSIVTNAAPDWSFGNGTAHSSPENCRRIVERSAANLYRQREKMMAAQAEQKLFTPGSAGTLHPLASRGHGAPHALALRAARRCPRTPDARILLAARHRRRLHHLRSHLDFHRRPRLVRRTRPVFGPASRRLEKNRRHRPRQGRAACFRNSGTSAVPRTSAPPTGASPVAPSVDPQYWLDDSHPRFHAHRLANAFAASRARHHRNSRSPSPTIAKPPNAPKPRALMRRAPRRQRLSGR